MMQRDARYWTRTARALAALGLATLLTLAWVSRAPEQPLSDPFIVNDVSQLNPVRVDSVIVPTTTEEIVQAIRSSEGPISIGGARHSMGGQVAAPGGLHIDMRAFNQVLAYASDEKRITVQAGATWRQIQERIDRDDLSIAIMQSYADFTVGGSLSVNVHGRYVGLGPIILSVSSFRIVLADGSVIAASRTENAEVFFGAIGGYGGLGVITDVTLELADNVRLRRTRRVLPVADYAQHFMADVAASPDAILHNGDLYPPSFDTVHAVTYVRTADPVTVSERLIPAGRSYRLNRLTYWGVSEWPFGGVVRQHLLDPIIFRDQRVSWRNYEASYEAEELEPASRRGSTYLLQEYFVPVERFDDFVRAMRSVFERYDVNVVNVSVRHAKADPGSLLAWAKSDVFAFVVYYKQDTDRTAREQAGEWTRELIDAALAREGSFYLPYELHATRPQFLSAYPRASEFLALKQRLDPMGKFRNALMDRYFQSPS